MFLCWEGRNKTKIKVCGMLNAVTCEGDAELSIQSIWHLKAKNN